MSLKPALATMLLLTNAACQAETGKKRGSGAAADPGYGDTASIKRYYSVGEESSVLHPCDKSRAGAVSLTQTRLYIM
jgi:hypothetical protein